MTLFCTKKENVVVESALVKTWSKVVRRRRSSETWSKLLPGVHVLGRRVAISRRKRRPVVIRIETTRRRRSCRRIEPW